MDTYDKHMAGRFREALVRRAGELGRILHHEVEAAMDDALRDVGDFKDAAVQESAAAIDEAQAAHAAIELRDVQAALARLADGSYGMCLDCGDAIDLRRLTALPATAFCTSCQSAHEKAH
jgi:DnaK suppressor protein